MSDNGSGEHRPADESATASGSGVGGAEDSASEGSEGLDRGSSASRSGSDADSPSAEDGDGSTTSEGLADSRRDEGPHASGESALDAGVGDGSGDGADAALYEVGSDTPSPEDDPSAHREPDLIELPEVDLAPVRRNQPRGSTIRAVTDLSSGLRGAWRLIDAADNAADFAPGGFDECVIGIDSASGVLQVYRAWGRPPTMVVAGHFLAEFLPDGTLILAADPDRPHAFSEKAVSIAGSTMEPPRESIEAPRRWRLVASGELEIDGRRYARTDRATFERLSRGSPPSPSSASAPSSASTTTVPAALPDERRSTDFFGTAVKGRRICFIVDRSGSMSEAFKMQTALRELDRCIRSLPPDREFYVLFFDEGKLVVEDRWISADPASAGLFLSRLPGVQTGGGTNPHSALEHAFLDLRPVPDEIHLMTDGLIPFQIVEVMRGLNSGAARTVVHTYAFTNREGEGILKQIADEHGGTYRFVP